MGIWKNKNINKTKKILFGIREKQGSESIDLESVGFNILNTFLGQKGQKKL